MLSILIPSYNFPVSGLVRELSRQAEACSVVYEIIVMDDASSLFKGENEKINAFPNCRFIELSENIGRAKIRNRLADESHYPNLLFIDGDARVCSGDYIKNYLPYLGTECAVIGGVSYDPEECDPLYSLRLKYGRKRETFPSQKRKQKKFNVFTTFNFLIYRPLFEKIRFDETIRSYGHEDTLFGHRLSLSGCEVRYINNPLIHIGLDVNEIFLQKTEEAVKNLWLLHRTGNYPFLKEESGLLKKFTYIQNAGLACFPSFLFKKSSRFMRDQLCGSSPSLFLYDMYRLFFLCYVSQKDDNLSYIEL